MSEAKTWCHINDATENIVRDVMSRQEISYAEIIVDGDCGSVWGEEHPEHNPCPHPHVLIKDPTKKILWALRDANIGYTVSGADWSEFIEEYNWTEDKDCPYRNHYITDYRVPYPRRDDGHQAAHL